MEKDSKEKILEEFRKAISDNSSIEEIMHEDGSEDSWQKFISNTASLNEMARKMRKMGIPNIDIIGVQLETLEGEESKHIYLDMLSQIEKVSPEELIELKTRYGLL